MGGLRRQSAGSVSYDEIRRMMIQTGAQRDVQVASRGVRRRFVQTAVLLFLLAFSVRMAKLLYRPPSFEAPQVEMVQVAHSLLRNGFLGNPYAIETGPTAHELPIYPVLLAGIYRLFGETPRGEGVKYLLTITLASLQYALLPALAQAVGLQPSIGVVAGLMGALLPVQFYMETAGNHESHLTGLVLLALSLLALRFGGRSGTLADCALFGAACGVGALVSSQVIPVSAGLLGFLVWPSLKGSLGRRLAATGLVVAVAMSVLFPWALRNRIMLGEWIWTRSNFGLELYVSNHDRALPILDDQLRAGLLRQLHPHSNVALAAQLREQGEAAYHREKLRQALAWIQTHPGRFLRLTLARMWYFWFPPGTGTLNELLNHTIVILAFVGFGLTAMRHRRAALLCGILLGMFPLVHYVVQVTMRYRYPIHWTLLLLASVTLVECAGRLGIPRWIQAAGMAPAKESGK